MTSRALWIPLEVAALDRIAPFYTVQLGLSEVDRWDRNGERGVVFAIPGPAYVELVQPAPGAPPGPSVAFALEQPDDATVDAIAVRAGAARPARFPRGHYGVTVPAPDRTSVLVWSER